jgi:crotonobetainyl-CoA:carnitine CoA-transferase CaiB-like acyl-CoA transferase
MGRKPKVDGPLADYDFGFDVDNRGKQSIVLALDTEAGADAARRLIARADVFLCNLLTQRQAKFGLDPKTLLELNPRLVHATLTGYGVTGPEAWRPGFDVTAFFGRSGIYDAMREADDGIVPMARPAQGDHTTGLALVGAILGALRLVDRTGQGQVVETSLLETAIWTQATDFSVTAIDRAPVRRRDRHHQLSPIANRYPCGDGKWLVLNNMEEARWTKFCEVIGREEWLEDPRFATGKGRYAHMPDLVDAIDVALSVRTRDEWGELFDAAGIIWGPVLSLDEVAQDAQAEAIGMFPEIRHEALGPYRTVRIPMRFHTAEVGPRGPSPRAGEHTRKVLEDAGLSAEEIDALARDGVLGANGD